MIIWKPVNTNKKKKGSKKKEKRGFTLIELIAVIVILGILMVVAIPAVTRYIDNSKKETLIKEINSLVDTVRYGLTSGNSTYSIKEQTSKKFDLKDIELEKGRNTVREGYLKVIKSDNNYQFIVQVTDEENDNCFTKININDLDKNKIIKCSDLKEQPEYEKSNSQNNNVITFAGSDWYILNDSSYSSDYVTVVKKNLLTVDELGDYVGYMSCSSTDVRYGSHGCTRVGQRYKIASMALGYRNSLYPGSNVEKFLNEVYINQLGEANLTEDENGYKIRVMTLSECYSNERMGFEYGDSWLMDKIDNYVYTCNYGSNSGFASWQNGEYGAMIRPVINLLKTSIED